MGVNFDETNFAILGKKYWENFCRRYPTEIERKKAVKFDSKRDNWCTKDNFSTMYDDIYKTMVEAGVALELHEHVYLDKEANTVLEDNPARYGCKTKFKLTHPERVLFVDKVGENTSQKQEGHLGLRKLVVVKGTLSQ
jgi:hypothetical protein